jgi:hypothetical protein
MNDSEAVATTSLENFGLHPKISRANDWGRQGTTRGGEASPSGREQCRRGLCDNSAIGKSDRSALGVEGPARPLNFSFTTGTLVDVVGDRPAGRSRSSRSDQENREAGASNCRTNCLVHLEAYKANGQNSIRESQ